MKNRQLKFRIWNKTYKEMFYPKGPTKNKEYEEKIYLQLDGVLMGDFKHTGIVECSEDYIIQQWTGEYDKNRKEIYEGDIISSYSAEFINENYEAEIVFLDAAFHAKVSEKDYRGVWSGDDIEVMGNIFQLPCNPDHNGECLVCDNWVSDCPFNKENNKTMKSSERSIKYE
jgi:uncharacterized phage protein (TIGR01671 family)